MKFNILFTLSAMFFSKAFATALPPAEPISNYTPAEWQAKWDTWPTTDMSSFRRRVAERQAIRSLKGNSTTETDLSSDGISDVCERITGCLGKAAATTAEYGLVALQITVDLCSSKANAINAAMSANNYKLSKQVAGYVVTNVAIPILIVGTVQYYFNLKLQNNAPVSSVDSCGVSQVQAIAEQASTATYGFCLQLRDITSNKAFSRVDFGTVSTDNTNDDVGLDMAMRLFISTEKGKNAAACSLLGVELKQRELELQSNSAGKFWL